MLSQENIHFDPRLCLPRTKRGPFARDNERPEREHNGIGGLTPRLRTTDSASRPKRCSRRQMDLTHIASAFESIEKLLGSATRRGGRRLRIPATIPPMQTENRPGDAKRRRHKHLRSQALRPAGAVGIEPTTCRFGIDWRFSAETETGRDKPRQFYSHRPAVAISDLRQIRTNHAKPRHDRPGIPASIRPIASVSRSCRRAIAPENLRPASASSARIEMADVQPRNSHSRRRRVARSEASHKPRTAKILRSASRLAVIERKFIAAVCSTSTIAWRRSVATRALDSSGNPSFTMRSTPLQEKRAAPLWPPSVSARQFVAFREILTIESRSGEFAIGTDPRHRTHQSPRLGIWTGRKELSSPS